MTDTQNNAEWERDFDFRFTDPMTEKYGDGIKLYCSFCIGEWRSEIKSFIGNRLDEARDSERNRIFAILRHLAIPHDATEIMKIYREWGRNRPQDF